MAERVNKYAPKPYIQFAEKQFGKILTGKPTWEDVYDVVCGDMEASIYTHCQRDGDNTLFSLSDSNGELIMKFDWPNANAFNWVEGDWQWDWIYKEVVSWFYQNRKNIYKTSKPKKVSKKAIKEQMALLKVEIRGAGADLRRKLIDEYNELAKKLEE